MDKSNDNLDVQKEAVRTLKNTLNSTGIRDNEVNVKLQHLHSDSEKREFILLH